MKNKGLNDKTPMYKTAEYRILCFLDDFLIIWLSRNIDSQLYYDMRKPLSEIKDLIKSFLERGLK